MPRRVFFPFRVHRIPEEMSSGRATKIRSFRPVLVVHNGEASNDSDGHKGPEARVI